MKFTAQNFFDTSDFVWRDVISADKNVWEIVKKIDSYIEEQLKQKSQEKIFIDEGSIIQDTARIEGKALIGKNCVIGHGVLLRGGVVIGDNVTIGHGVEIKHSVIFDNSAIAHLNYVGDSVIGRGVNISGGAILANWRFDKKSIKIRYQNQTYDTGMEKCGAFIGDNSTIGVNAVLNPGTILGKGSFVYPLTSVKGSFPDNSIIKER